MSNRFWIAGELQDAKIVAALKQAAEDFENGEIVEVDDCLIEIHEAIQKFMNEN